MGSRCWHASQMRARSSPAQVLADIQRSLPPGSRVGDLGTVLEVRAGGSEAVLLLRWARDPNTYGIPIPLGDVDTFFGWPDEGVEERLALLDITLMEELGTGLVSRARRHLVGDYIELAAPDWPADQRFFHSVAHPDSDEFEAMASTVRADGLDPSVALASAQSGSLVTWVLAGENNRQGQPYVGQAVITGHLGKPAVLQIMQLTDGVPLTVAVDLAHLASHRAGEAGFLAVRTDIDLPVLDLVGYRPENDGTRVVDTTFLNEDRDRAAALLAEALRHATAWGHDRDLRNRHIPEHRTQRWLHRLRHPLSGRAPRTFAMAAPEPRERTHPPSP